MDNTPKFHVEEAYDMEPSEEAKRLVNECARAARREANDLKADIRDNASLVMMALPKDVIEHCGGYSTLGKVDPEGGYVMWNSATSDQWGDKA